MSLVTTRYFLYGRGQHKQIKIDQSNILASDPITDNAMPDMSVREYQQGS